MVQEKCTKLDSRTLGLTKIQLEAWVSAPRKIELHTSSLKHLEIYLCKPLHKIKACYKPKAVFLLKFTFHSSHMFEKNLQMTGFLIKKKPQPQSNQLWNTIKQAYLQCASALRGKCPLMRKTVLASECFLNQLLI